MKKYMGNKSRLLSDIYKAAQMLNNQPCTIFDAFAGTTNVGRHFKKNGYRVISNDVNSTSKILGEVYIRTNTLPSFTTLFNSSNYTIQTINRLKNTQEFKDKKRLFLNLNQNTNDCHYLTSVYYTNAYDLLVYLSFFASNNDFESKDYNYALQIPDFIWRNYCFNGTNSRYFNLVAQKSILAQINEIKNIVSETGANRELNNVVMLLNKVITPPFDLSSLDKAIQILQKDSINCLSKKIKTISNKLCSIQKKPNNIGNRLFFSEEHGRKIDAINNLSLIWLKDNLISETEYYFIQCSLIEAVALFSNTSATYQAFYKTLRANTQQTFRLIFPEISESKHRNCVFCEDTFELVKNIKEPYDILYLDPPYNWRIYDSNYHLLNLLANYSNIADNLIEYEAGITGAAGENREVSMEYTNYNRRETFESLLFELIQNSKCKYVILSYSDSPSNHNKNSDSSLKKIEDFFINSGLFIPNTYKKIIVNSVNFESRKNEEKEPVNELLFIAQKK